MRGVEPRFSHKPIAGVSVRIWAFSLSKGLFFAIFLLFVIVSAHTSLYQNPSTMQASTRHSKFGTGRVASSVQSACIAQLARAFD